MTLLLNNGLDHDAYIEPRFFSFLVFILFYFLKSKLFVHIRKVANPDSMPGYSAAFNFKNWFQVQCADSLYKPLVLIFLYFLSHNLSFTCSGNLNSREKSVKEGCRRILIMTVQNCQLQGM